MMMRLTTWLKCAALAVLAGCGAPDPGEVSPQLVGTPLEGCCLNAETYPRPLIEIADPLAPLIGRTVGAIVLRDGYLQHPEAEAAVLERVRPLDLMIASSKGRLSGQALPGLFSHVVIYLGNEKQLKALGMWDDPTVVPFHAEIRAGNVFIEADSPGVHLSSAETVLHTDAVVILRPEISKNSRKREVMRDLYGRIGKDFDFRFDNATTNEIYCAELANITMPELKMPTRMLYGRRAVVPNDVVALAATGRGQLDLVAYVRGRKDGWKVASTEQLLVDMYNPPEQRQGS